MGVSGKAENCEDCGLVTRRHIRAERVLGRLPDKIFNRKAPQLGDPGAIFDLPAGVYSPEHPGSILFDITRFGADVPEEPTPQYELARVLAEEVSEFIFGMDQAAALQLGLGILSESAGGVAGMGPRATGTDLDKLGEQYGIGRPPGFTDCCYWRLVQLLRFMPGPPLLRFLEIAELYTGSVPQYLETPDKISLTWPTFLGDSYFDQEYFIDQDATFYDANFGPSTPDEFDGYLAGIGAPDVDRDMFFDAGAGASPGLTLILALHMAKPAGVAIELFGAPQGQTGCFGASLREAALYKYGDYA